MNRLSPRSQKQQLKQEIWFHGSVSRSEAESMLTRVNIYKYIYRLIDHGSKKYREGVQRCKVEAQGMR